MKRLCFLSPDVEHARSVVADLLQDGIEQKHIYTLARPGTELQDLPDAGPEDNDFLPAFERGAAIGGTTGVFLGLLALSLPPAGLVIGGGGVLLIGVAGASYGALMSSLAGAAFKNTRLKAFEEEIDAGKILIMVDVPIERITDVNRLIQRLEPDIEIEGVEPPAPLIPR